MNEAISSPPYTAPSLPYATPAPKAPRLAPAVWIAIIGLALIFFGGCFMIGIMVTLCPHPFFGGTVGPAPMSVGVVIFLVIMFVVAFACFGGALALLLKGVKTLLALIAP